MTKRIIYLLFFLILILSNSIVARPIFQYRSKYAKNVTTSAKTKREREKTLTVSQMKWVKSNKYKTMSKLGKWKLNKNNKIESKILPDPVTGVYGDVDLGLKLQDIKLSEGTVNLTAKLKDFWANGSFRLTFLVGGYNFSVETWGPDELIIYKISNGGNVIFRKEFFISQEDILKLIKDSIKIKLSFKKDKIKFKLWRVGEKEPTKWTIETLLPYKTDKTNVVIGCRQATEFDDIIVDDVAE